MAVCENVLIRAIKSSPSPVLPVLSYTYFSSFKSGIFTFFFFCSTSALLERVSEIENRCAEKLREMESRVDTAKKEHTKAGSGISSVLSQALVA